MAPEKILIIGATGYLGKFVTKASLALKHPTFLLVRPSASEDKAKAEFLESVKASGATILHGSLEDYDSLVSAIKQVDVVISTVGGLQIPAQTKIIDAIKEVGTIKRFVPSEFGIEYASVKNYHPVLTGIFAPKLDIRKAAAEAGVPYTIVVANAFAGYFLANLVQPGVFTPPKEKVTIWGDGNSKAIFAEENDIGTFTIKGAVDPRTLNKVLHIRPPANYLTLNEAVSLWEKKIGKELEKTYVPAEAIWKTIDETPFPNNIISAIVHSIFVLGDQSASEVEYEATALYPDVAYTTADAYLSRFV